MQINCFGKGNTEAVLRCRDGTGWWWEWGYGVTWIQLMAAVRFAR